MNRILSMLLSLIKQEPPCYYIKGADELPPPLSARDEQEYLLRLRTNKEDLFFRNKLIEHNLRLVVYIAKKFENTMIGTEDLVSIGTIGLVKAVNSFDSEKNIKLATYASRCIENEILMFIRKNTHQKNEVSIDEPLNTDGDGNELLLGDVLECDSEGVESNLESREERDLLRRAVANLEPRDRTIIVLRFGLNGRKEMTQKEVADRMNISQSYISRLEKKIIHKLKKEIV